jgi:hypothetical protein
MDWTSDRVRGKAWGKQEGEGWFGEEVKEEARGATAHTFGSHCCRRGHLPLSPPTPTAIASAHPIFPPCFRVRAVAFQEHVKLTHF